MKHEFAVKLYDETYKISFVSSTYNATNGIYIGSIVSEDDEECPGEPWSDITVCLPDVQLGEDEVVIPTYNMVGTTYDVVKANLIEREIMDIQHGYATSKLVKLKPNWREIVAEME